MIITKCYTKYKSTKRTDVLAPRRLGSSPFAITDPITEKIEMTASETSFMALCVLCAACSVRW